FKGDKIKDWEEWYLNKHPEAISLAATKIFDMVNHFKEVMTQIDKEMIEKWVKDLVIIKTFVGLKFQEAILKYVAKQFSFSYRLAEPQEESQGIDGFINVIPVSIKPISYEIKKSLSEKILVSIIFYKKLKDGIKISYNENVFL
ncbi:MAG: restriction endonuclease, partial [Spirochaetes bacterium RIFOXYB1_FULL_32_8]